MNQPEHLRNEEELESTKIRRCLRTDDGKVLYNLIHRMFDKANIQLFQDKEPVDVYRRQGYLAALSMIMKMRED
jgi:hypothetical protein